MPPPRRKKPPTRSRNCPPLKLEILEDRTLLNAADPTTILDLNGLSVNHQQYNSNDILVRFQTPPGGKDGPAVVQGTSLAGQLPLVSGLYRVDLSKGTSVDAALAAYRTERGVLDAEPDYHLKVSALPNDPLFNQQWNLNNSGQTGGTPGASMHAEQAWDVTTGSPNIVVAVMDTGIDYNNPDLYQNIWINQAEIPNYWYTKSSPTSGYNKIVYKSQIQTATPSVITFRDLNNPANRGLVWDNNGDGRIDAGDLLRPLSQGGWDSGSTKDGDTAHPDDFFGWNFVDNSNNPYDDNGHGTNVAGILGAQGNNGAGVAGVDWNVPIMPVKFIAADGSGSISSFIQGLYYAVQHGAKITNNSWEGAPYSTTLYDAIHNAQQHGQIFVAAAGNEGSNDDQTIDYPASFSRSLNNVVAVAATDDSDHLAGFSNWGPSTVALAAPGVNILSTLPGGSYGAMSGTSMATPEVAGALALVWGEHPTWSYSQVIAQVVNTTDKLPSLQGKVSSGGRLDLAAAVGWNLSTRTQPTITAISAQGPTDYSMNSLWLTFNEPIDVSSFPSSAVSLIAPNGQAVPITVRVVNNSADRGIALIFPNQTTPGTYRLAINSSIRDLVGDAMAPYQATIVIPSSQVQTASTSTSMAITSGNTIYSTIAAPSGITIGHLQVRVNVSYPDDGDLYLRLIAPNGTTIPLVDRRGGTGANFTNTVLDDSAGTPIAYGQAPFSGWFKPEERLQTLDGMSSGGVWKLQVQDVGPHSGTLLGWSLVLTPATGPSSAVTISRVRTASVSSVEIAALSPPPVESASPAVSKPVAASVPLAAPTVQQPGRKFRVPSDRVFTSPTAVAQLQPGLMVGKRTGRSTTFGATQSND